MRINNLKKKIKQIEKNFNISYFFFFSKDQIHRDSLRLLENAGIDFRKFYEKGID